MHIYCRTPQGDSPSSASVTSGVKRFPCDPSEPCRDYLLFPRPLEAINVQLIELPARLLTASLVDLGRHSEFLRCHDGRWGRGDGLSCDGNR